MTTAPTPKMPAIAPYVANAQPYVPGKPIEELERELGIRDIIKLASNENPLGPSPKALAALENISEAVRLYPDANHYYLREELAGHNSVSSAEIIVGNGSNEVIEFLIRAYCLPGDNVVSCGAAFIAYRVSSNIHGVAYREAPVNPEFKPDLDAMLALCDARTKIVFLPNPNNPTGTYIGREALEGFLQKLSEKQILFVLDSAYMEYVTAGDFPDPLALYRKFPNVVILRTFSKAYGLAGLRVGYGIAHPQILDPLLRVKMPFNVSSLGLIGALAAMRDLPHLKRSFEVNCQGLDYFYAELDRLGLHFWKSQGNFVLVDFEQSVRDLNQKLLADGVITRPTAGNGLQTHLRITVGTMEQNRRCIAALEKNLGRDH